MARPIFYPSNDAYTLGLDGHPYARCPVRVYSAQVGGFQITDLVFVSASGVLGAAVPGGILYSDANGLIPAFAGPEGGAGTVWGDHGYGGARLALTEDPTGLAGGTLLSDGSVTTPKLADGAATGSKLGTDVATTTALSNGLAGKASNSHAATHAAGGSDPVALAQAQITGLIAALANKADLVAGLVPNSQVPPLAITNVTPVASQAAMLALTAQRGDVAIRTDTGQTLILSTDSPTTLADWKVVPAVGAITSVAGKTGVVALAAADITSGTFDIARIPVGTTSTTVAAGNDARITGAAPLASPHFTGTPLINGSPLGTGRQVAVDIRDFSPALDGTSDDTSAWTTAAAQVYAAGGGTIVFPAVRTVITSEIVVKAGVNIQGQGHGADGGGAFASQFLLHGSGARLTFGVNDFSLGGERGGRSGDFNLIGDGTPAEALRVNLCASREFSGIDIRGTVIGVKLRGSQNNTFSQVVTESCTGDGWVLDLGPGGNAFLRCGANASGGYDLALRQTVDNTGQGYAVPTDNYWFGCIFEREPGGGSQGSVYHGAGLRNVFFAGVFSKLPGSARSIIKMTRGDNAWQGTSSDLILINPSFQGSQATSTALELANSGNSAQVLSYPRFQNLAAAYKIASGASVFADTSSLTSSVTALITGTAAPDSAIRQYQNFPTQVSRTAAAENVTVGTIAGESGARFRHRADGQIDIGDGTGFSYDTNLYRKAAGQLGTDGSMFLASTTAPATPTAGVALFVEGGALKFKDSTGLVTTVGGASVTPPAPVIPVTDRDSLTPGAYEPDASTTGLTTSAGSLATYSGPAVITTADTTYQDMKFTQDITIGAANVTFVNCWFAGGTNGVRALVDCSVNPACVNAVFVSCLFQPTTALVSKNCIRGRNFTLKYCDLSEGVDLIRMYYPTDYTAPLNITVLQSYLHDVAWFASDPDQSGGETHNDCIQLAGSKGTNWGLPPAWQSGAVARRNVLIRWNTLKAVYSTTVGDSPRPDRGTGTTANGRLNYGDLTAIQWTAGSSKYTEGVDVWENWIYGGYRATNAGSAAPIDIGSVWRNLYDDSQGARYLPGGTGPTTDPTGIGGTFNCDSNTTVAAGDGGSGYADTANANHYMAGVRGGVAISVRRNA